MYGVKISARDKYILGCLKQRLEQIGIDSTVYEKKPHNTLMIYLKDPFIDRLKEGFF